jgi:hypothetical protein
LLLSRFYTGEIMNEAALRSWLASFEGVATQEAYGYTFFFFGDDRMLPFVTLANSDNEHDKVSNLSRTEVYRLNIGVRPATYRELFGPPPAKPGASGIVETGHDFTALDQLMPHPHYAPQNWLCVLSPSEETMEKIRALVQEAYSLAFEREQKRARKEQESKD